MERMAEELSRYLRGWIGYFGKCETPSVLAGLEQWLRRRLRVPDHQTQQTAQEAEHNAFCENLANQSSATCAHRESDCDLLSPCRRARQQQVRHIRTRDQQHDSHYRQQHGATEQDGCASRAAVTKDQLSDWLYGGGARLIRFRILSRQCRRDGRDIGLCPRKTDARL